MASLQNENKIQTILAQLRTLEEYSKNKSDEAYGKSVIEKQKICIFNLLENRELEERILEALSKQIKVEEQSIIKAGNNNALMQLTRYKSKELNLEAILKKDIQLMKSLLRELFKVYELQKDLTGEKYITSLKKEHELIDDFKSLLNNILNSENRVQSYFKQLATLKYQVKQDKDYDYMGLHIPGNIKLLDPISKYDLEPFLVAYRNYESALRNFHIHLKYSSMTADFMRSQYTSKSLFLKSEERIYILLISDNKDERKGVTMTRLTFDEKRGWFAHELKHILSYTIMSAGQLRRFTAAYGFRWALSYIPGFKKVGYNYLKKVEGETHEGAIKHESGYELAVGTDYFFNKSDVPKGMKDRYGKVYPREHEVIGRVSKAYFDKLNSPRIKK